MAKGIAIVNIVGFSAFLLSFSFNNSLDDIWKQLGISQQTGTSNIKNSFLNGFIYYYGAATVRTSIGGNKAAATTNLLTYVKQYVGSDGLKGLRSTRQSVKPTVQEKRRPVQPTRLGKT